MKQMKLALVAFSLFVFQGSLASAECVELEPLCHSMHTMVGAMGCLDQTTRIRCGSDADEVKSLQAAAKDARVALVAKLGADAQGVADATAIFDQLDAAIVELSTAVAAGDAPAKATALAKIVKIKKQGHMDFK